jgi:hypothetical protein
MNEMLPSGADCVPAGAQLARFAACVFDSDDVVEVRRLPSKQSTWHKASELPELAGALGAENAAGQNIYAGANPRSQSGGTTAADVALARCVFADFDGVTCEVASAKIKAAGLPSPTLLIDSGHGAHAYWRLAEPLSDLPQWTAAQKQLIAALQSDKAIHDPPRIMRLPGFLNVKNDPHVACRIVRADAESRYSLDSLLATLPAAELPEPKQTSVPLVASTELSTYTRAAAYIEKIEGSEAGGRNQQAFRVAAALQKDFALSHADAENLLRKWNQRNKPPLDDGELVEVMRNAAKYGTGHVGSKVGPLSTTTELSCGVSGGDGDPEPGALPVDPGPLSDKLIRVPGFVENVIDFNLAGAFRPQPALALAGALTLLATLTGRKIADRQGSRTNLYCLGVCGTSQGKERAREVNKEILCASGLDSLLGPESFASAPGLFNAVALQPAILFQLDEIGRYLKTMGDAAKSPHLYNIVTVLMRMFTSSSTIYKGDAYADSKRNVTINQPHACVYGTTTPDVLYGALTSDNLTDGFLSRVLIFEGGDTSSRRIDKPGIPSQLVRQAKWWGAFKPGGGNLESQNPQPMIVEATPEALQVLDDLRTWSEEEQKRMGEPLGLLWPRAVEKANKLALLYACSVNASLPFIEAVAAQWAVDVVKHLTARLVFLASRWLAENPVESKVKRVYRIIEGAGPGGIRKSTLTKLTQWLYRKDRDEILVTLEESGQIKSLPLPGPGTKPATIYVATRYVVGVVAKPTALSAVNLVLAG